MPNIGVSGGRRMTARANGPIQRLQRNRHSESRMTDFVPEDFRIFKIVLPYVRSVRRTRKVISARSRGANIGQSVLW